MKNVMVWLFVMGLLAYATVRADAQPGGTIPISDAIYLPLISNIVPTLTPTATLTRLPTATPLPTVTPVPVATATATQSPTPQGQYICDHDAYNCSSFATQAQAQAVLDYCESRGAGDIHGLDADHDGRACESLPRGWVVVR